MINFGVATGVSNEGEGEQLNVYLHIATLGSISISSGIARMLAVQLTLNADLVDADHLARKIEVGDDR